MAYKFILLLLAAFQLQALGQSPKAEFARMLKQYHKDAKPFFKELGSVATQHRRNIDPSAPVTLTQIQQSVVRFNKHWQMRSGVMAYFHVKNKLHVFLVTEDNVVAASPISISVDSLLNIELLFRSAIGTDFGFSIDRKINTRGLSIKTKDKTKLDSASYQKFSTLLVPPVVSSALDSLDHLLVSPVYNLHSFPFAILKPFNNNQYLLEKVSIQVLPSLYEFATARYDHLPGNFFEGIEQATMIGNPYFLASHRKEYYKGNEAVLQQFSFAELPNTRTQIMSIHALLRPFSKKVRENPCFLQEREALKSTTISCVPNSDVIYIASHGVSNASDSWDSSFLVFTRQPSDTSIFQNLWTCREIYSNQYKARLAVLSACNTGTGQLWKTGVISLASAFYYAGVERVVSTLWNVSDYHTFVIMEAFMKRLAAASNEHPSVSIRKAQLSMIKESPKFWAPFVLYGQ